MVAATGRATGPRLLRKRSPVNQPEHGGGAPPRQGSRPNDGQVRFRRQRRSDGHFGAYAPKMAISTIHLKKKERAVSVLVGTEPDWTSQTRYALI